jgi:hypothetical protein
MQANTTDVLRTDKMASRRERRAWRAEFRGLGIRQTRDRERISAWYQTPGKAEEARRWLREQERPLYWPGALATIVAAIVGAIVGALITSWLK